MIEWDRSSITWYEKATAMSDYPKVFLPYILEIVRDAANVADVCCGIGPVSTALAKKGYKVTAIDSSPRAIAYLQRKAAVLGLHNLSCVCQQWEDYHRDPFDSVIAFHPPKSAYFTSAALKMLNRLAVRSVALLISEDRPGFFWPLRKVIHDGNRSEQVRQVLRGMGAYHFEKTIEYDFGQPLDSEQDLVAFITCHLGARAVPGALGHLVQKMQFRNGSLYLPIRRKSTLFLWRKSVQNHR